MLVWAGTRTRQRRPPHDVRWHAARCRNLWAHTWNSSVEGFREITTRLTGACRALRREWALQAGRQVNVRPLQGMRPQTVACLRLMELQQISCAALSFEVNHASFAAGHGRYCRVGDANAAVQVVPHLACEARSERESEPQSLCLPVRCPGHGCQPRRAAALGNDRLRPHSSL